MISTTIAPQERQPGLLRDVSLILFAACLFGLMATTASHVAPLGSRSWLAICLCVLFAVISLRRLWSLEWSIPSAVLLLLLTLSHPLVLYAVSSDPHALLSVSALAIACIAALDLWQRPGTQARILLGLSIAPLVVLSGGPAILLALALLSPLTEPAARKHFRVFWSLLVVALMPSAILLFAAYVLHVQTGETGAMLAAPFLSSVSLRPLPDLARLHAFITTAFPLMLGIATIAVGNGSTIRGAALALILPTGIAFGGAIFTWDMPTWAAALLAPLMAFFWMCRQTLRPSQRAIFLVALGTSALLAWQSDALWQGSSWRDIQLKHDLPLFIRGCTMIDVCPKILLRPALPLT
jgi:hypothetical protein